MAIALAACLALGAAPYAWEADQSSEPPVKKEAKVKKSKKAKAPKPEVAAPDEPLDSDAELDATQTAVPPAKTPQPQFVWKQHPSLRFGKTLRLDFEAKFQEDYHSSYDGAETTAGLETWELHRNRIGVQGTAFKHIDFEIERELTEKELTEKDISAGLTPQSPWKDVYVNVDYVKNAQIKAGKFKVPFGLDQLTGVTHNDFVYRSLGANYLSPARDIGVMAHGRFFKRGLSYASGVFVHDGDNARSKKIQGGDATAAARVTGIPLRRAWGGFFDGLELGTAMTVTKVSDDSFRPNGLRGRTIMTQDYIFAPVYVKGMRRRWEADADWTKGPASLRAEYTHVIDERQKQGFGDEDLPDARYRSWYVAGTWILTGEKKARPVKPALEVFGGGFGAIEIVGRVERIWFDSVTKEDEAFANPRSFNMLATGEKAVTVGLNWTLNRFVKVQIDAIREQPEDPGRNPLPNGASFWSRVLRLQLVL